MPILWNPDQDRKLLLRLIDPGGKHQWGEVASDLGPGFTSESVR